MTMLHDQLQVVLSAPILVSVSCRAVHFAGREAELCVWTDFFTTRPQGVGMGLSIRRSIAEAQDGRLWAAPFSPMGWSPNFGYRRREI
jgi:hypothetical protein